MDRKGHGGELRYGYRVIGTVKAWTYRPQDETGAGTVEADVVNLHPAYAHRSDVTLELHMRNGGRLLWPECEMLSDSCFVVPKLST